MSNLKDSCSQCGLSLKRSGYYCIGDDARHINCGAAAKHQLREAHDLLRRIRESSEDDTLSIPDVVHAMEAEITELLGDRA